MRFTLTLIVTLWLLGCKQNSYDKVWSNYEWLPPGSEGTNPYTLPPRYAPSGYGRYPTYDNDADYVQPRGWGLCGNSGNLGNCE